MIEALVTNADAGRESIYVWPVTFITPIFVAASGYFLFLWPKMKPTKESLGQVVLPGDKSGDAAAVWASFAFSSALCGALGRDWGMRLEGTLGSALLEASPFCLVGAVASAVVAGGVYLFAGPSILIPPQLRGDVGRAVLWWRNRPGHSR